MSSYGLFSVAPIAIMVIIAIVFRKLNLGLLVGLIFGSFLLNDFQPWPSMSFLVGDFVLIACQSNHIFVIAFTMMIGGLSGILIKTGASRAFITASAHLIKGRWAAPILGTIATLSIFFDEHSNRLYVTTQTRKLSHKLCREKLAYFADTGTSSLANLALVSLPIAFFVTLIHDAVAKEGLNLDAYELFIKSIPYNFYAIFGLATVLLVALSGRDFGAMLMAEQKWLIPKRPIKPSQTATASHRTRAQLVLFFVTTASLILATFVAFMFIRLAATNSQNSYAAMTIGASIALYFAIFVTLRCQILEIDELFGAIVSGIKNISEIVLLMILAWAFASSLSHLHTMTYLAGFLSSISPNLMPTMLLVIAAISARTFGSMLGAMAILTPIALPIIFMITTDHSLYLACLASLVGGAMFGDQTNNNSDAAIWSSLGSRCDIAYHVTTQLPYAMLSFLLTFAFFTLPFSFGYQTGWSMPLGLLTLCLVFGFIGRRARFSRKLAQAD